MVKKKKLIFVALILLLFCLNIIFPLLKEGGYSRTDLRSNDNTSPLTAPQTSINLEGTENIKILDANRTIVIEGTGLLFINDSVIIKNKKLSSISSILLGIPSNISENLVYLKAINEKGLKLDTQLTDYIMEDSYQIIEIDLLNPLESQTNRTISIFHCFKDIITYEIEGSNQILGFTGYVFPLFPYEIQNEMTTQVVPYHYEGQYAGYSKIVDETDWGEKSGDIVAFKSPDDHLDPFLANLDNNKTVSVSVEYSISGGASSTTKVEMSKIDRTIEISPWGIVTVRENYYLTNKGPVALNQFKIGVPKVAVNVKASDFFGDLILSTSSEDSNNPISSIRINKISMGQTRGVIESSSTYQFSLEYQVSLHHYLIKNIVQQTLRMNLCTSYFPFLQKNVNTEVIIDGCFSVDGSSIQPDRISFSTGETTVSYNDDYITPSHFDDQSITLTYTVDSFGLLFWPILYIIIIAALCVLYIYFINRRKRKGITPTAEEKEIPINEIREFCTLYSEKTALKLEIRDAEADLKRKKIPKKKYRMLVKKNENKIDAIEEELKPFKETLMETSETFESLVKRLDVLETERQTVLDGLNLLDLRYRKGKLPSRSAYMSLKDDFQKRLKKIDRSIDKTIQQLRGYLI